MSSNRRAGGKLWTAATISQGDASPEVFIGANTNAAVFIQNGDDAYATFKIQASGNGASGAGRNAASDTWFDVLESDNSAVLSFVVAAGGAVCYNLSDFAASRLRLVCTAATTPAAITGFVETNG